MFSFCSLSWYALFVVLTTEGYEEEKNDGCNESGGGGGGAAAVCVHVFAHYLLLGISGYTITSIRRCYVQAKCVVPLSIACGSAETHGKPTLFF